VPINRYHSREEYEEALEAFHGITGTMLFEFAQHGQGYRDTIVRNFVARTNMMARAVFRLWDLADYHDCWILHRCLLDRLFHLQEISDRNQFELFEAWSFLKQYDAMARVRSDPGFQEAATGSMFELSPEQHARAKTLRADPPKWRRPKAEGIATRLNMHFLYRYGYDFGSTHVHPMANDGHQDFFSITGLQPAPDFPDQRVVLSNTLLVATMVVQLGMNASTLRWRAVVYDFLDELRDFLGTGSDTFKVTFVKLGRALQQGLELAAPAGAG
jgi:hypothetical protein